MKRTSIVMALLCCAIVSGCATHNQLDIAQDGTIAQDTSTANVSRMDAEGGQVATNLGLGPTLLKQDAEGNWVNTPGPVGVLSYVPATGQFYLISPQDAELEGVQFTPNPSEGQPSLKVDKMKFNLSEPLKQAVTAFAQAATSLQGMTQIEATARVEQMKAAGEITSDVANLLLSLIVPTLTQ
ncbi:MAG: hypothetical protein JXL80_17535 [Planctomycetes bacterium]|nr:hypothetical protein [Planctomycetota bacterium]